MSFHLPEFEDLRPFLYHLTSQRNVAQLQKSRGFHSASELLNKASLNSEKNVRRRVPRHIQVDGEEVVLRDQAPLIGGNVAFEFGWDIGKLVHYLNEHVFFWPGSSNGPIPSGARHFQRYADEATLIFRFRTTDLFRRHAPLFSAYNSGAPRCSGGKKSPRGSSTFLPADLTSITRSRAIEVVFKGFIPFPDRFDVSNDTGESWQFVQLPPNEQLNLTLDPVLRSACAEPCPASSAS